MTAHENNCIRRHNIRLLAAALRMSAPLLPIGEATRSFQKAGRIGALGEHPAYVAGASLGIASEVLAAWLYVDPAWKAVSLRIIGH